MPTHVRLTAALLVPLLAFGPSCASAPRQVRLEFERAEVLVTPQAAPPVEVSEAEFRSALAQLSHDAELVAFFKRPVQSGRLHLVPASFAPDDPFVSGYQRLCASRRKPADCLNLLQDGLFDADDRQTVATSVAFHSILAGVAQELGRSVDPDRVYAMVTSAMVGFMVVLAFPDPITKLLLAALALAAITYMGVDTFYSIRLGWSALKDRCAGATSFADIQDAGQQFGTIVGENVGRIVVMLVLAAMGATLGSFTARLSSLPGFTRFAQMFQLRFGFSFGAVTAGQVSGVTISASSVTIAMAPGVAMSSIRDSGQPWDSKRPTTAVNQGGSDASPQGRDLLQDLLSIKSQKGLGDIPPGTRVEAESLGRAWVNGKNVSRIELDHGGYGLTDGVRTFRLQYKPRLGGWQANFQENTFIPGRDAGLEIKNIHMKITDMVAP